MSNENENENEKVDGESKCTGCQCANFEQWVIVAQLLMQLHDKCLISSKSLLAHFNMDSEQQRKQREQE